MIRKVSPILSIKVRLLVAPSTMLGRFLANFAVSEMTVGTTIAMNAQIKPTTTRYASAIGSL